MNKPAVLLVEDNDDDVELTRRSFERHGFTHPMLVVRNGQEALDYVFCHGAFAARDPLDLPILVLLDIKLPKVNGLEVLRQIRAHAVTQCVPVVILTTSSQAKDKLESYRAGANSFIRKPVDFDLFSDMMEKIGTYWLRVNDPPIFIL